MNGTGCIGSTGTALSIRTGEYKNLVRQGAEARVNFEELRFAFLLIQYHSSWVRVRSFEYLRRLG